MLGKLLKYDLKKMFKFLVIFYGLAIFFALLTRIFFSLEQNLLISILGQIATGATVAMIINILINSTIRLFVSFKNNLYGDEGYLINTLPIKRTTIFLEKVLLAMIVLFCGVVVICAAVLIAYYSKENFELLKMVFVSVLEVLDTTMVKLIVAFVIIVFLEILTIVLCGITGINLGHKKLAHKVAWSEAYGLGLYLATQIIVVLSILLLGVFVPEVKALLFENAMMNVGILKTILIFSGVVYAAIIVGLYLVGQKAFEKIDIE